MERASAQSQGRRKSREWEWQVGFTPRKEMGKGEEVLIITR